MITVGVTGGIGSGKTTVINYFKELGIEAYIADDRAKLLMHKAPLKEEITQLLGEESYDDAGNLDRGYIAGRVFSNKSLLAQLNGLVHPRVEEDFKVWLEEQSGPYTVYEAAILFETGRYTAFDYTILVTAPVEERISRLRKRDDVSEEKIRERMENQWPDKKKEKLADWVIVNTDLEGTRQQVLRLHDILSRN